MKKIEEEYLLFSRKLRRKSSVAEQAMWSLLRDRHFSRYKFRRQYVIQPYIVDFICLRKKLIIELDGEQHLNTLVYDSRRTDFLEKIGYRVIRFWNQEVFYKSDYVIEAILAALRASS